VLVVCFAALPPVLSFTLVGCLASPTTLTITRPSAEDSTLLIHKETAEEIFHFTRHLHRLFIHSTHPIHTSSWQQTLPPSRSSSTRSA
jgi:hypothetical protein